VKTASPPKRYVPLHGLFRCFPLACKCLIGCYIAFVVFNALIALTTIPALAFVSRAFQPLADWLARFVPAFDAVGRQLAKPRDAFMLAPVRAELALNLVLSVIFVVVLPATAWIDLFRNPVGVRDAVNDVFSRTTQMPETSAAKLILFSLAAFAFMCSGLNSVYTISLELTVAVYAIIFGGATKCLAAGIVCAMIARQNRIVADSRALRSK
jgi:hypothetical protein